MKKNKEKLDHALHNEDVCNYLELRKDFSDWIITTAFYSALQFVSYKIFPFNVAAIEGKSTEINTIDQFYRFKNKNTSKHDLLAELVEKNCNEIFPEYQWLLDMSITARYVSYQHDKEISVRSITLLKKIKKACI